MNEERQRGIELMREFNSLLLEIQPGITESKRQAIVEKLWETSQKMKEFRREYPNV